MVLKEYRTGNAIVRICDGSMAKTEEENRKILERIARLASRQYELGRLKTEEGPIRL